MTDSTNQQNQNLDPILRGFCAALRSKDSFLSLKDVFTHMNKIVRDVEPGPKSPTVFLDKVYNSNILTSVWTLIEQLYERDYAPIRKIFNDDIVESKSSDADVLNDEESNNHNKDVPLENLSRSREELEYLQLLSRIFVLYPPPLAVDKNILTFADYFKERTVTEAGEDFSACVASLEVTCIYIGNLETQEEQNLLRTDPSKALLLKEERIRKIRSLFTRTTSNFVGSSSSIIKDLLFPKGGRERVPFLSGSDVNSMDGQMKGFHSRGLICFIGGTSGFKTGVMSSIVANHCLTSFLNRTPPAQIWGYVGEDGVESYTRRILTNIMNRDPFVSELGFNGFSIGQFDNMMADDKFKTAVYSVADKLLAGCYWLKPPEDPTAKLKFSVLSIISAFDTKLESGAEKPKFIVIDYLNLLKLPRELGVANRAQEMSVIAHLLDEWGEQKGIPIVTSVQASVDGAVGARDMRFYNQEDIHECKSIQHHCRMMISLLPYTDYSDQQSLQRFMALYVLKNRDGMKGQVFISNLNEGANLTFADSKYFSEVDWTRHKQNVINRRNEVFGEDLSNKPNGGRPGGKQNNQGRSSNNNGYNRPPSNNGGNLKADATSDHNGPADVASDSDNVATSANVMGNLPKDQGSL